MSQIHLPSHKIYQLKIHQLMPLEVKNIVVVFEGWDWDLALLMCLDILRILALGYLQLLLIENWRIRLLNMHFLMQLFGVIYFRLSCQDWKCCVEYYWVNIKNCSKCSIAFVDRLINFLMCIVFSLFFMINCVVIQVIALKS